MIREAKIEQEIDIEMLIEIDIEIADHNGSRKIEIENFEIQRDDRI